MTTARTVATIGGGTVLAAWLASAAGVPGRQRPTPPVRQSPADRSLEFVAADVQSQASRLRHRLASAPAPQAPFRNPFAFGGRESPKPRAAAPTPPPVVSFVEQLTAEPHLSLIGLAAKETPDAGVVRTAILSDASGDIFLVVTGEVLVNRYRVVGVAADSVELRDQLTGATRRLALK